MQWDRGCLPNFFLNIFRSAILSIVIINFSTAKTTERFRNSSCCLTGIKLPCLYIIWHIFYMFQHSVYIVHYHIFRILRHRLHKCQHTTGRAGSQNETLLYKKLHRDYRCLHNQGTVWHNQPYLNCQYNDLHRYYIQLHISDTLQCTLLDFDYS